VMPKFEDKKTQSVNKPFSSPCSMDEIKPTQ